jgi:hypothetical protein
VYYFSRFAHPGGTAIFAKYPNNVATVVVLLLYWHNTSGNVATVVVVLL